MPGEGLEARPDAYKAEMLFTSFSEPSIWLSEPPGWCENFCDKLFSTSPVTPKRVGCVPNSVPASPGLHSHPDGNSTIVLKAGWERLGWLVISETCGLGDYPSSDGVY
uniref:Uncharacterized protein n=1 Tax=Romanomermis culicivorax TaxID=13658 RepID=A0A915HR41_ROMCU